MLDVICECTVWKQFTMTELYYQLFIFLNKHDTDTISRFQSVLQIIYYMFTILINVGYTSPVAYEANLQQNG